MRLDKNRVQSGIPCQSRHTSDATAASRNHNNPEEWNKTMPLTKEKKNEILKQYQRTEQDTGSAEVQIAMLSKRISDLTEHLKTHPKDYACRRGLVMLVGKRRRLLNYYKNVTEADRYKDLLSSLNLRK